MAPVDDGHAVHYTALQRGVPVISSDGKEVGKVVEVLDNYREHIFDGLVIETTGGERKFVDAPEVARTAERAATLTITSAEVAELGPPPSSGPAVGGPLKRLLGRRR
jgi:sporulation protein YlmC with PRC-barrel domain